MTEQKIAPVLVKEMEQMALDAGAEIARRPMYGRRISFAPDQLIHFLGLHEQAVLARVGAVREQALEEAANACTSTMLMNVDSYCGATANSCANRIRALKGTPAAAVAEPVPFLCNERSGQMTYRRAATFLDRFKHDEKMLGPNEQWALEFAQNVLERLAVQQAAPQPSTNPGPLAAVEPSGNAGELERAAERYRYLRAQTPVENFACKRRIEVKVSDWLHNLGAVNGPNMWGHAELSGIELDEAVDAAIAASKEGASHG